jgi:hypothetical protein
VRDVLLGLGGQDVGKGEIGGRVHRLCGPRGRVATRLSLSFGPRG